MQEKEEGWMTAKVPGEIHLDLMNAGKMPDPIIGKNMPECRWPETMSWWYRTRFDINEEFLQNESQTLVFEGLDLYAQVFINGNFVGEAFDAFIPAEFKVKWMLCSGSNELVIRLTVGSEIVPDETDPGQGKPEHKPSSAAGGKIPNPLTAGETNEPYGHRDWIGRKWVRKPQFSYGWDWVDALPNIGIWRGVSLKGYSYAIIQDIRLDTLIQNESISLEMDAIIENLHAWSERTCVLELEILSPGGSPAAKREYIVDALPGRMPIRDIILIPDAQLWWPNTMGEQPLYMVKAWLRDTDGICHDSRQFSIGLRTIGIDRSRLGEGSRLCLRVNGIEVFCRGANIGPFDPILARITDEKYARIVSEAKNTGMNTIRINGCSIFESEIFYEECDKAGIMIWQDFMLTLMTYPDHDDSFCSLVEKETEAAIRLLRHHPSIVLWCGNNETTWILPDWWNKDLSKPLDIGGHRLCGQVFPDLCHTLDPKRPYWYSSPCGGEYANSELSGDCHYWEYSWLHDDPLHRYRHETYDSCRSRFLSEYGVIGPCHIDSIKEYLSEDEMKFDSPVWQLHTGMHEKGKVMEAIAYHYKNAENLTIQEYVNYGQMFQAIIHGYALEALRFRKYDPIDDCQGALVWSFSDCWGETGWSLVDYYMRRKPSYYWFKRACKPIKIIVRQRNNRLITRVVNDTLQYFRCEIEAGWWRIDGTNKETNLLHVAIEANSMLEVCEGKAPEIEGRDSDKWVYAAVMKQNDFVAQDQSVLTFKPYRELGMVKPEIEVTHKSEGIIEITSPVFCHGVHMEDNGYEIISDNWFDLLPGVPIFIEASGDRNIDSSAFNALVTY
ncbi:MAG: hypothetical protein IT210_01305 [Armatimonadetes bacterium]|nr:hypothetical protein [Armatimonadota bacterium]